MSKVCKAMKLMSPHGATVTLEGTALIVKADCPGRSHVLIKNQGSDGDYLIALVPIDWAIVAKPAEDE